MIRLLKNLLPREPAPAHLHFHLDDHGNEIWCDESACRPERHTPRAFLPPHW
jgi:hypothetical protein